MALYGNAENVTYFDSSVDEYIPKQIRNLIEIKLFEQKFTEYKPQDSIMCVYFCIISKGKILLEYTNLFSSNECKNNDKIILKYFQ